MNTAPNFFIIQADQLAARALPAYGNSIAVTPYINRLAEQSVVFEHAYCNYPLCAPSRFSMLSGLLPSHAGAYDNGAEFPAGLPSFVHYLRLLGYQTSLAGKMHFIGPDQLHGFEERLTTDIYPSDFNWTANWGNSSGGGDRLLAAAGEVNGVLNSGIYERTIQLDYDDEVTFRATRKLHDLARSDDTRPFCFFASFTHPHDPFAVPQRYWDRYQHEAIDMPSIPAMAREKLDPHSQRLYDHIGVAQAAMSDAAIRRARHAYYGAVSYIDDQVGQLVNALSVAGLADNTVVILISDHGEALGERGLWFKRAFYDCALQIPFLVCAPSKFQASRVTANVSLVDLFPTLIDLADPIAGLNRIETRYDGHSLRPLLLGEDAPGPNQVIAQMTGEGLDSPAMAIIDGSYKYIYCEDDPALLFDRATDPNETHNLAGNPSVAVAETSFCRQLHENWDLAELKRRVLESQAQRRVVDQAHALGATPSWDYDLPSRGSAQYFRPCAENPSASNYNKHFELRARPDSELPNKPKRV